VEKQGCGNVDNRGGGARPGSRPSRRNRDTERIANATLGDYLVPDNADVPDIDVVSVGKPDPLTPLGAEGVGEIGLLGIGAAVANAIYHAVSRDDRWTMQGCLMEIANRGQADGLRPVDWAAVAEKLDAGSAPAADAVKSRTTSLSTINEDGSPHLTAVGAL
jgi:hypothetical protein